MTIAEKKQYLRQYSAIERSIVALQNQIEAIRDSMLPSGIDYSKDRVQTSPCDSMLETYSKLYDKEQELMRKYSERQARLTDIINCINSLKNLDEQNVLTYRYINGAKWEDIADYMYMSRRTVINIHGKALENFAIKNS